MSAAEFDDAGSSISAQEPVAAPTTNLEAKVTESVAAPPTKLEAKVEEPVAAAPPSMARPGAGYVWNPKKLTVPNLPDAIPGAKLFEQQFVPEYLKDSPAYLTGSMAGDIAFDPWCLVPLAKPNLDSAKRLSTAEARNKKMLAMSPEEQAECVAWMRNSELKHARLAMMAVAGWPLAELANRSSLRFATNGRAPSLFNGHLLDFWPFLFLLFGGLGYLEFTTKDKIKDGDFGFDPLGFASGKGPVGGSGLPIFESIPKQIPNVGDLEALKLAEIKNGRAAMMAITGFAVQEFFWGKPVVDLTPMFF
jgi:light-harvesting complex II chlorophyll a/b binding protein 4